MSSIIDKKKYKYVVYFNSIWTNELNGRVMITRDTPIGDISDFEALEKEYSVLANEQLVIDKLIPLFDDTDHVVY